MDGVSGKVAVVTGGAKGIGAATVNGLVSAGANVAIADIDSDAGQTLGAALGPAALFLNTDVTSDDDITSLAAGVVRAFGGIDILVNCAVTFHDDGLDSSREAWLASFNTNVVSPARMLQAVAPSMRSRGGGAVVNFSSIAAKFGQRGRASYPASKAAVLQLTRNQAMHYASDNIRVNAISPGWTWAGPLIDLAGGDLDKGDRVAADYFPLGRMGRAEDVAGAVLYLCSDQAKFVTGIDLPVDGGYAMSGPDQGTPMQHRLAED